MSRHLTIAAAAFLLALTALPALSQDGRDMGAGHCGVHGNYTGGSCPSCGTGGGPGGGPGGGSRDDSAAEEEARRDRQRRRDALTDKANAAWRREDYRAALENLLAAQRIFDGPNVRDAIQRAHSMIAWNDARSLHKAGDNAGSLVLFQRGLDLYAGQFTEENRRFVKELEATVRAEREKKEKEDRERRNRPVVDRLRTQARALMDDDPVRALGLLEEALKLIPGDAETSADWFLADASRHMRLGAFDAALQSVSQSRGWRSKSPDADRMQSRIESVRESLGAGARSAYESFRKRLQDGQVSAVPRVDLRVARFGAHMIEQVPELQASPAADRIERGFEAVRDHDWPVALAMWQEALQRDPGNAALQRSVDLAEWMVGKRREIVKPAARPLDEAILLVARGDTLGAVRRLEVAKYEDPSLAAQADRLIMEIQRRPASEAGEPVRKDRVQAIVGGMLDTGYRLFATGKDQSAEEALESADLLNMNIRESERPYKLEPPRPASESRLDFQDE